MSVSRSLPPSNEIVDLLTIEKIRRGLVLRLALRDWALIALIALLAYQGLRVNEAVVLRFDELIDSQGKAREHLNLRLIFKDGKEVSPKSGRSRQVKQFDPVRGSHL